MVAGYSSGVGLWPCGARRGVLHWVVGALHRVLGLLRRVVGVLHRVLGVLRRVLGVLHRVVGLLQPDVEGPLVCKSLSPNTVRFTLGAGQRQGQAIVPGPNPDDRPPPFRSCPHVSLPRIPKGKGYSLYIRPTAISTHVCGACPAGLFGAR